MSGGGWGVNRCKERKKERWEMMGLNSPITLHLLINYYIVALTKKSITLLIRRRRRRRKKK